MKLLNVMFLKNGIFMEYLRNASSATSQNDLNILVDIKSFYFTLLGD